MLATRGGSRTSGLYHNSDRSVGSVDQCSLLNPRFEPSIATRGRGRPQHANYVRTTRTVRRPSSNYDTRRPHPQGTTTGLSQRWRHEEGLAPRSRLEEGLRHVDHHGIKTQLVTVVAGRPRVTTRYFPPGLYHGRHPYFYRMDIDTSTGLPPRVSPPV